MISTLIKTAKAAALAAVALKVAQASANAVDRAWDKLDNASRR
jgi:hypothetical protein